MTVHWVDPTTHWQPKPCTVECNCITSVYACFVSIVSYIVCCTLRTQLKNNLLADAAFPAAD